MSSAENTFQSRADLRPFGDNARLLFALELRFQIDDICSLAANALTDSNDDKKCDLIYVDTESGLAVVAQGYETKDSTKASAPSNKASDLNTATTWLLSRDLNELPERLRAGAQELRQALHDNKLERLEFWYVHNLPESTNVKDELKSVEHTAKSALTTHFPEADSVEVSGLSGCSAARPS
jgi:hypothetical protein